MYTNVRGCTEESKNRTRKIGIGIGIDGDDGMTVRWYRMIHGEDQELGDRVWHGERGREPRRRRRRTVARRTVRGDDAK